MQIMATGLSCLSLGLICLSFGASRQLTDMVHDFIDLRFRLKASPYHFWREYCRPSRDGQEVSAPKEGLDVEAFFFRLRCRREVLWFSQQRWHGICEQHGRKAVFSPRYYRLSLACWLEHGERQLKFAQSQWQIYR